MAYIGNSPKFTTQTYRPQSADPSNPGEGMVFRSDGTPRAKGLWEYREGNWQRFGSDDKTYISNYNFDSSTTSWATYADAAGVAPVDGAGGSPSTTLTSSTSSPLRGTASGLITKDAANRQGEGISTNFTIDTADQGKVLNLNFDFTTSSAYVAGDIRVYLYDVTNSLLIEGNGRDLAANSGFGSYYGSFQTSSNSTSYRLILHISSTNASAYTVKIDNFIFGAAPLTNGAFVSDWQSYTPTFTGLGTVSGVEVQYRRVGAELEVYGKVTSGTTTANNVTMTLPSGLVIATPMTGNQGCGYFFRDATGSSHGGAIIAVAGGTTVGFSSPGVFSNVSVNPMTIGVGNAVFGSSEGHNFRFTVPIVGWSSNITLASQTTNQVIALKAYNVGGQTISSTSATTVQYNTIEADSAGAFNTGTYTYTIPEAGYYFLSASYLLGSYISEEKNTIRILRNGTSVVYGEGSTTGTAWVNSANGIRFCNKGDTITVTSQSQTDASYTVDASQSATALSIFKIQGNQTIGYDEVVAASYETNAAQSITGAGVDNTILFEDKIFDSHNAMNTGSGEYTIPVSGVYSITAKAVLDNSTGWAVTEVFAIRIMVDNVEEGTTLYYPFTSASNLRVGGIVNLALNLNRGQVVKINIAQTSGGSINLTSTAAYNQFSITRIK